MKQIIFLVIILLYSVLQARRKALRGQKRKEAATASIPRGAVSDADDNTLPADGPEDNRWTTQTEQADQFIQQGQQPSVDEIKELSRKSLREKKRKRKVVADTSQDEVVERLVKLPEVEDAYNQRSVVRRAISFDKASMRTFLVTREVLGPPRSRRPFRPGIRGRE